MFFKSIKSVDKASIPKKHLNFMDALVYSTKIKYEQSFPLTTR